MMHEKSPEPNTGTEALSDKNYHTRNSLKIKQIKKRLPPNGRFYQDVLNGVSQFPDEPVVLIYIGKDKPWKYAKSAIELGLQPPIVVDAYINPEAYKWPVKGLKVRVLEREPVADDIQEKLAQAFHDAGAVEIQFSPFGGYIGVASFLSNPRHKVVRYE